MILTETPRRKRVSKLVGWGHWFAFSNMLIAIVIASIYIFNSPLPDTLLGNLYLLANWFGHIGFLVFFGFVIFILPLCYLIPNAKLMKGLSSVLAAVGLALLAFDALLYTKQGLHLALGSAELIRNETSHVISEFGWLQWGYLALLFVVWLSFQLMMANALWKRIERFSSLRLGAPITSIFVICFFFSHSVHIWADANLYQPIIHQDDMFPLSYPATAKTLMEKNGLLDIESYQQRKSLQLDHRVRHLNYPVSPLYCAINKQKRLVLLVQTDSPELPDIEGMTSFSGHYDLSSNALTAISNILYGLPELYHNALQQHAPILLDLPKRQGLDTWLYGARVNGQETAQWSDFLKQLQQDNPIFAIGFVTVEEMQRAVTPELLSTSEVLVTTLNSDAQVTLLSNINRPLQAPVSSHLDIAATLLEQLQCQANSADYTTGQSMLTPKRNWLITTQDSKVIMLTPQQRIEVDNRGNAQLYTLDGQEQVAENLNIALLSQGIKHLSRFSSSKQ